MDIHDLPGAVQALERGEVMSNDLLIYVLCGALMLASILGECLFSSIQREKEAR